VAASRFFSLAAKAKSAPAIGSSIRRKVINMTTELEDVKINVKQKLAALWTSFMFLYIYVDYFHLYMPGSIKGILEGKMFVFEITQVALLIGVASLAIPALMIFLSIALSAIVNRRTNIIVAAVYIPYTLFNLAGEVWMHMVLGAAVEVALLSLIIICSWKWPKLESPNT
jgi:hypothetical protein